MTDDQLMRIWTWGLAGSGAIVVVAATLLIAIRLTAGRILKLAGEALETAEGIVGNTAPIWRLEGARSGARELLHTAGSIEGKAAALADALQAHEERR